MSNNIVRGLFSYRQRIEFLGDPLARYRVLQFCDITHQEPAVCLTFILLILLLECLKLGKNAIQRLLPVVIRLQTIECVLIGLAHDIQDGINLLYLSPALAEIVDGDLFSLRQLLADFLLSNGKVLRDAIIKAQSARSLVVQGLHITDQLLPFVE